jgi:TPR repeat protein
MPLLRRLLICIVLIPALCASLFAQPPNFAETKKRAEAGAAKAQNDLGHTYNFGEGVPQNYEEALKWYRKAADQGYADAQYNLGVMYYHGQCVPQDYEEAARWCRKAADQGHDNAQYNIGIMYIEGDGIPKDDLEAYAWFNLVAASSENAKLVKLAKEMMDRFNATPEEKARAQKRSTELFNEIEARKKAAGK